MKLKDKKIILYKSVGVNSGGFVTYTYEPIHPGALWAYVRQTSASEFFAAAAHQMKEEMLFVVNWRADLSFPSGASLYVKYKGIWYDIERADTFEGYKQDVSLYAKTMSTPNAYKIRLYPGE